MQVFGVGARGGMFCGGALWFWRWVLWGWHRRDAWVSGWRRFRGFCRGGVFQQTVGIPMGASCAPLLADVFLCSYEADFVQSLLSTGKRHLASRFSLTYGCIDDVLSMGSPEFESCLGQMCPAELGIRDAAESTASASYLDLLLSIGRGGQLHTSIYDKRDDFNFHITNFPFLSSNIPSSPAYGVFISQLVRYARACSS